MTKQAAGKKEIFGWAMFDFANQAYTLLIITVIYGDLFTRIIVGDAHNDYRLGNLLWSLALSISYLLVVATAPILGAVIDFTATRKGFLFVSYLLTVVTTSMLYLPAPGFVAAAMVLLILSNYAYAMGESFIAGFLPDLGRPEDLGKISGFGWALGYVGGLTATAVALLFLGDVSLDNFERIRWVGPFAGGFFLVAAIPTFLWLKDRGRSRRLPTLRGYPTLGLRRIRRTCKDLVHRPDLFLLFGSIFFSMCGIYIIITFTFIYGAQVIRWDESVRVQMFVIVQITATLGALVFGFIQDRIGAKVTYAATLMLWIVTIVLIYLTPQLTDLLTGLGHGAWRMQDVFLVIGCLAGTCLGSTQSAGRTLVALFSPSGRGMELFGFWGLVGKAAAIVGLLGIGLLQLIFGLRSAILFCALLFGAALLVILFVDEQRGRNHSRGAGQKKQIEGKSIM